MLKFQLSDSFNKVLPADPNLNNNRRQVKEACFSFVEPRVPSAPKLLHTSEEMAKLLGLDKTDIESEEFLKIFSGAATIPESKPYAMCYGGHQFGHWAGQLGDGRAINLAEVKHNDQRWTLQLKGAGETPYSRSADGLAVLRSSIREHLCSEAMYHLGVPTTRSLSLCLTGDQVLRDVMYDGNQAYEKGAVVCRVAPSFIRFGNFQIFASRGDKKNLKILADYTIKEYFPTINLTGANAYEDFFNAVVDLTLKMVVDWQRVGFVHGVMNTDNMSILGLTIDYGPYGWLEGYDHGWTPNTTDRQQKRYRYGHQAAVALWNLYQLANSLYTLTEKPEGFELALKRYQSEIDLALARMNRKKLGLDLAMEADGQLIERLQVILQAIETDMTIFYRQLATVKRDDDAKAAIDKINTSFYNINNLESKVAADWKEWMEAYLSRLTQETKDDDSRKAAMNQVNPKYVLRNYMAQLAIDKADQGDYSLIEELYQLLKRPYDDQSEMEKWYAKRPEWARHKVGCSMLSCSS